MTDVPAPSSLSRLLRNRVKIEKNHRGVDGGKYDHGNNKNNNKDKDNTLTVHHYHHFDPHEHFHIHQNRSKRKQKLNRSFLPWFLLIMFVWAIIFFLSFHSKVQIQLESVPKQQGFDPTLSRFTRNGGTGMLQPRASVFPKGSTASSSSVVWNLVKIRTGAANTNTNTTSAVSKPEKKRLNKFQAKKAEAIMQKWCPQPVSAQLESPKLIISSEYSSEAPPDPDAIGTFHYASMDYSAFYESVAHNEILKPVPKKDLFNDTSTIVGKTRSSVPVLRKAAICKIRASANKLGHFAHAMEEIYKCFDYWIDSGSNGRTSTTNNVTTTVIPILLYDKATQGKPLMYDSFLKNTFMKGIKEFLVSELGLSILKTEDYYRCHYASHDRESVTAKSKKLNVSDANATAAFYVVNARVMRELEICNTVYHRDQTIRTHQSRGENGFLFQHVREWNTRMDSYMKRKLALRKHMKEYRSKNPPPPEKTGSKKDEWLKKRKEQLFTTELDDHPNLRKQYLQEKRKKTRSTININSIGAGSFWNEIKVQQKEKSETKPKSMKDIINAAREETKHHRMESEALLLDDVDGVIDDNSKEGEKDEEKAAAEIVEDEEESEAVDGQAAAEDDVDTANKSDADDEEREAEAEAEVEPKQQRRRLTTSSEDRNNKPDDSTNKNKALAVLAGACVRPPRIGILNRRTTRIIMNADDLAHDLSELVYVYGKNDGGNAATNTTTFDYLAPSPVENTFFEQKSFVQQVEYFRNTDILISGHGAQLTGLPFMANDLDDNGRSCKQIMELFPNGYALPYYFGSLAVQSGVGHSYVYYDHGLGKSKYHHVDGEAPQARAPVKDLTTKRSPLVVVKPWERIVAT
jgi:uncharacterized protein YnzC (UPF0291/DUF896 family)